MTTEQRKQLALEKETLAYKHFMKVAKKINYIQYGKWEIVPSANDPLRQFTLERKTDWFTLKISLFMQEYYHRAIYDDTRTDWRPVIRISGLFKDMTHNRELYINTGMKLKPRMARKLIKVVDELILPKFYLEIDNEVKQRQAAVVEKTKFLMNLDKVPGLKVFKSSNTYVSNLYGELANCPFNITIEKENVSLTLDDINYEKFAEMAKLYGWGK